MFIIQIAGDIFGNNFVKFAEQSCKSVTLFRRHLESYMEELTQVKVAGLARHIMVQGQNEFIRAQEATCDGAGNFALSMLITAR
jgi:hypothetical protein